MSLKDVAKKVIDLELYSKPKVNNPYFLNNSKNSDTLMIILAGYKKTLWDNVFKRIENYVPKEVDICLVSSGVYDDHLNDLAQKNNWSYVSIKRNNINLAQNTAIDLFPHAQTIIKMDEDIFITENTIQTLLDDFQTLRKQSRYEIGTLSPLININGYSYLRLLKLFNKVDEYEKLFGKAKFGGLDKPIENSVEVARFMWGYKNYLPSIDEMNKVLQEGEGLKYSECPIRLTIGLFVMSRSDWNKMGGYKVRRFLSDFGEDENQVNSYCILNSKAMVYDEKCVVGHFSFHYQDKEMVKMYKAHPEYFKM